MGVQETIIYRLVMRNRSYNAYFSVLNFWATFVGKMGVATTRAHNSLESGASNVQTQPKFGPLDGPFGPTAISKLCFRNLQG